jgi:hypothetical protein
MEAQAATVSKAKPHPAREVGARWRRQMAVSPAAKGERRTRAAFTSRCERRNVNVDARVYAAASNAALGANGERRQVRTSEPPALVTTLGRGSRARHPLAPQNINHCAPPGTGGRARKNMEKY